MMKMIVPADISSDEVFPNGAPQWDAGVTYSEGDVVVYSDVVYVAEGTTLNEQPDVNPGDWSVYSELLVDTAMNGNLSDGLSVNTDMQFSIKTSDQLITGIAIFGVSGSALEITVGDSTEGVVYEKSINLFDQAAVTDWYEYFFSPTLSKSEVAILDLPPYLGADINIKITAKDGVAYAAEIVVGLMYRLGESIFGGTSAGFTDFSTSTSGQITEQRQQKNVVYSVIVDDKKVPGVLRLLSERLSVPTVYFGSEARAELLVYGFYKDFDISLEEHNNSLLKLEVEGLIL